MDTLGNVVDKLLTVNLKIWYNQNSDDIPKMKNLGNQRKSLTNEVDDLSNQVLSGQIDEKDALRPQHKTY